MRGSRFMCLGLALVCTACAEIAPKVLIIGVDGLRADQVDRVRTPTLDRLAKDGFVWTDATNARKRKPWNGQSATNWSVLLTGVDPDTNRVTGDGDDDHAIADRDLLRPAADGVVRSMFGHAKSANPKLSTAVFHTWADIAGAPGTILGDCDAAIDYRFSPTGRQPVAVRDAETCDAAAQALAGSGRYPDANPDLVFVHLSQVDVAGHRHTWNSNGYRDAIVAVDHLLGRIVDAVDARAARHDEHWLVILTSNHGGPSHAKNHTDNTDPEVYRVPFYMRPDVGERAFEGTPTLYDIAPTALAWLGVDVASIDLDETARILWHRLPPPKPENAEPDEPAPATGG